MGTIRRWDEDDWVGSLFRFWGHNRTPRVTVGLGEERDGRAEVERHRAHRHRERQRDRRATGLRDRGSGSAVKCQRDALPL